MIYTKTGETFAVGGETYTIGNHVIGTSESEYEGLFGFVTEIRTGEDKETDNETPDIYVDFIRPELPHKTKELEKTFSELYGEEKTIDDICLDCVIMAPSMIVPIHHNKTGKDVYAVIEEWITDDGDVGSDIAIYDSYISAKFELNRIVGLEKDGGMVPTISSLVEESDEDSYEAYEDGRYNECHYSARIVKTKLREEVRE